MFGDTFAIIILVIIIVVMLFIMDKRAANDPENRDLKNYEDKH